MTLHDFLTERKLKPTHFADMIGVAPSTVIRWVKGDRTPTVDFLMKIKAATSGTVNVEDFAEERAARKERVA